MKKIIMLSLASVALFSCTNMLENDLKAPSASKVALTFEGGFSQTKTAFGEAVDGVYNLIWEKDDAIGIFSYDMTETTNENVKGELAESSIGMNRGIFIPIDEITTIPAVEEGAEPIEIVDSLTFPVKNDEQFLIYYPYKSGTKIDVEANGIKSTLANVQSQISLGDKSIGRNGFSSAMVDVKKGSRNAAFTLKHNMAYIAFKASSTEFAGYQLHAVQIFDKNKEAILSGDFIYDIEKDVVVPSEDPKKVFNSAGVKITNHDFAATPSESELYVTVFPGDYSAADMYVVVTFMAQDGSTHTIPFQLNKKCKFPAASLTCIDLGNVTTAMNQFPWFETYETRDLLDMYAYGSNNTYYAEHIVRSEGAEKAESVEVVIDVKARGDFSKVAEPKYYALIVPSEMGCTSLGVGTRKFLSTDGTQVNSSIQRVETPTAMVSENYTISAFVLDKTAGTGRWGTVGIYDENFNLLWSYLIIGYETGDEPKDVEYPGFTLMDRYLGQVLGNKLAEEKKTFDHTGGNVLPFFQWGRKDPFAWTNTNGLAFYKSVAATDDTTIEDGIKNPTTHYAYVSGNTTFNNQGDWYAGASRHDLWGGYNNVPKAWYDPDEVGHKTIFDPCPEGYRVPDARVFAEVSEKAEIWESVNEHDLQVTDPNMEGYYINTQSPFYNSVKNKGYSVLAYKLADGSYDYWFFAGYGAEGEGYTKRSGTNCTTAIEVWSNTVNNNDPSWQGRGCCMEYGYWATARQFNKRHSARKAYRYPVRCQKITK